MRINPGWLRCWERGLRAARADESVRRIDYHRVHWILAEGSFVLCVSEGNNAGVHSAFYDLFRIASGKLVEHWDTTEKIAPRSEWKNENGKFQGVSSITAQQQIAPGLN